MKIKIKEKYKRKKEIIEIKERKVYIIIYIIRKIKDN